MGSGKSTGSGNSRLFSRLFLVPKEWNVTPSNRSFSTKSIYKQTAFQDGDIQVSKTIDNGQRLGCLHKSDGCTASCSDTSDIQKIPSVHLRTSGLSVHVLTLWNDLVRGKFHKINGSNSSAFTSTCHICLPIPRRLADKRSDSQSTNLLHKFTFIGKEFLTQQNIVRVPAGRVETLILTIKTFLSQTQVSARTFLSLFGKLSAVADFIL